MDHIKAYEAGIKYHEKDFDLGEAHESFAIYCKANGWNPLPYVEDMVDGWKSANEGAI